MQTSVISYHIKQLRTIVENIFGENPGEEGPFEVDLENGVCVTFARPAAVVTVAAAVVETEPEPKVEALAPGPAPVEDSKSGGKASKSS